MFFISGSLYTFGGGALIIANLCFGAALVLYTLPAGNHDGRQARSSVQSGFAMGY